LASSDFLETIAEQAAKWAVMAEYSEMTPETHAGLDAWLAADRRHRGAFLRARAGLYAAEDAVLAAQSAPEPVRLVSGNDNQRHHEEQISSSTRRGFIRRAGVAVAGGTALAASVAAFLTMDPLFRQPEPAATEQIVTLRDVSVATLGKDARIAVTLTPDYRRITLVNGEATFKVASDKARPFVVQSGDVFAQATGTVYSVRRIDGTGGTVKVTEGSVLVWARDERDQAVQLHAGGELTLKPGPHVPDAASNTARPPHLPPPELAQFSFDNEPIRAAAMRFNHVNSTRIVIADPAIGDTAIVGLFRVNDPERFAQAAAALTGARVEHQHSNIVIKMQ